MDRIGRVAASLDQDVSGYTADTEVLTYAGWKFISDINPRPDGDLFATRNRATGGFEWQHASYYHDTPWSGEVVDVKGRTVDLRVTPDHRLLARWAGYQDGKVARGEILKPAGHLTRRGAELPSVSSWRGQPPHMVRFGRYEWDSMTFASFLGAWVAEGNLGPARKHVRRSNRRSRVGSNPPSGLIQVTQLPGTKGYEPYLELLTAMLGRRPHQSMGKTWGFACSDLWHFLKPLGKAATKYVPAEVKNWGVVELEAFLRFYLLGDGWTGRSSSGREAWKAATVSRRLADDLQEIAQKVGQSATITIRAPRDGGTFDGRTIKAARCRPSYYLSFNISACRTVVPSRSHYEGRVYGVAVPNEVVYVRRGGSPVWCGSVLHLSAVEAS